MELLNIFTDVVWIDILWISVGLLLIVLGFLGCFLPVIPGPPLSFAALLMLQLTAEPPFTVLYLLIIGGVVLLVTILDYVVPIIGAKKFGASKAGIWGSSIGVVLGLFFGLWGVLILPFVGALVAELIAGKASGKALKAAFGTFLGFLMGTLLKLMVSIFITYKFIEALF